MAEALPVLVFPEKRIVPPDPGRGFPMGKPHLPGRAAQVPRIDGQLADLQQSFVQYQANLTGAVAGLEPETVLVMEIVGSVNETSSSLGNGSIMLHRPPISTETARCTDAEAGEIR